MSIVHGVARGYDHSANHGVSRGVSTTTLTVALADSQDPVITAVNYSYTLVVTNTGALTANNVSAVVVCPANSTFVSASGSGWACNNVGHTVTCTVATLPVGAGPTITITVTSPGAGETSSATADAIADNAAAATQDVETTLVNLVSKDATSGKRVPNSATEWANFIAYHEAIATWGAGVISTPNSLYLLQEASGNCADSIGSLTLTANGTPLYAQAVSGWTRLAVGFTDNTSAQRLMAALTEGPSPATTSSCWVWYSSCTLGPAGLRTIATISDTGATQFVAHLNSTPVYRLSTPGGTTLGANNPTAQGVQPLVLKYNRTNAESKVFSNTEKLTGTYSSAVLDGRKGIGGAASSAATQRVLYGFMWSSTAGELTDANLKLLLVALGWTIAWS